MKKIYLILILTYAVSSFVYGQNEDQFLPSELKQLTSITEPITLRKGFLRIGTDWNYMGYKTIFIENGKKEFQAGSNLSRAQSIDLSIQYGLTDRIQMNLQLPYRMDKIQRVIYLDDPGFRSVLQKDYSIVQNNYNERGFGFGDLSASVFTQLVKERNFLPAISLRTTIEFPTGRKDMRKKKLKKLERSSLRN